MIVETCPCGATFTVDANGWTPSEAHAARAWRDAHTCPPQPEPTEVTMPNTITIPLEVAERLVDLAETGHATGDPIDHDSLEAVRHAIAAAHHAAKVVRQS